MLVYIFFAGIINGATLIIPGLSGALLLLIMGLYPLVVYSVSSIAVFLGDLGNISLFRDICIVLAPFGIGALLGCLGMARLMEILMSKFPKTVYAVILGLILGSVVTLIQGPYVSITGTPVISLISGGITFCAGVTAAYFLGKKQ
jgi:putative membrane protein